MKYGCFYSGAFTLIDQIAKVGTIVRSPGFIGILLAASAALVSLDFTVGPAEAQNSQGNLRGPLSVP